MRKIVLIGFTVLFCMVMPAIPETSYSACVLAEDMDAVSPGNEESTGADLSAAVENNSYDTPINITSDSSGSSAAMDSNSAASSANPGNPGLEPPADIGNNPPDAAADEEKATHQPKLILESNNLAAEKIQAGSEREFITCFRNKSRTDTIFNLSVSLKPADETISLAATSFYFESVPPQDAIAISTIARIPSTAAPKRTAIEFTFSYENKEGTAYNSSETAWLETFQPVQASMEGFDLSEKLYSMETAAAQIQVRNTGRAPIYNAQVVLNAPGLFPTESIFAGTLDAGASYGGSMKIYVGNKNMESIRQTDADTGEGAYGSTSGTLTLSYEDAFGQTYTQTQEFSTFIQEPEIIELTVEKDAETNSWWPAILAATILLFSAALAVTGWRLRRSRQKLEDLLLEEKMYER